MLGEIFYWVFNMSLAAALPVCLILLLRRIRHIPRRAISLMWAIPMVRFVMIAGISTDFSLMSALNKLATRTVVRPVPLLVPFQDSYISSANIVQGAVSYYPVVYKTNVLDDVFAVAGLIWAIIAVAFLIAVWLLYFMTMREVRQSIHISDDLYVSEKVDTPAVFGIVRPMIVLPDSMMDSDNHFVVLHERAHIRRMDNLWRMIAFMITAIHWFNPLSWVFLRCYLTDLELSCDESVLSRCNEDEKRAYAHTILDFAQSRNIFVSAFGSASVRLRLKRIMDYREITIFSCIGFLLLLTAVACTLLTNPK